MHTLRTRTARFASQLPAGSPLRVSLDAALKVGNSALEGLLSKAESKASDIKSNAHKAISSTQDQAGQAATKMFRDALSRAGIEVKEARVFHWSYYDVAAWRLNAKLLIPGELDDDEAEDLIEKVTGFVVGSGHKSKVTRGRYSRTAMREWILEDNEIMYSSSF
jgi:hypothetical protein